MTEWLNNNWIELTGAILAFVYLVLEIKQKWTLWIAGIISSGFYVYIFFDAKLYAETGMNIYYIIMSVYGLYCWKFSRKKEENDADFHRIDMKIILPLTIFTIICLGILSFILFHFTDSPVAFPDALIATFSITATWMVAKKIIECWYLWIFVNSFAVGLYFYQGLYSTAVLFIFYAVLSVVGLKEWRKSTIKK
ncbi:MAG: nicotinamide riboside transporter PnuC [Candidatus Symbiothrix sp.]|jgi:nicotinamide mononucleotide transporter|nr:nicotinamide riboside transporter PnuC [Candidatus Symbiothrix sp.]